MTVMPIIACIIIIKKKNESSIKDCNKDRLKIENLMFGVARAVPITIHLLRMRPFFSLLLS